MTNSPTQTPDERTESLLSYCGKLFEMAMEGFDHAGYSKIASATTMVNSALISQVSKEDYEDIVKRGAMFRAGVTNGNIESVVRG